MLQGYYSKRLNNLCAHWIKNKQVIIYVSCLRDSYMARKGDGVICVKPRLSEQVR